MRGRAVFEELFTDFRIGGCLPEASCLHGSTPPSKARYDRVNGQQYSGTRELHMTYLSDMKRSALIVIPNHSDAGVQSSCYVSNHMMDWILVQLYENSAEIYETDSFRKLSEMAALSA